MPVSKSKITFTLATLLLVSSCAEQEKLSEMHDATVKMERTTSDMNKTTGKMNDITAKMDEKMAKMTETTEKVATTTEKVDQKTGGVAVKIDGLSDMTSELYDALRQGNSLQLRREAMTSLKEATSMFTKLSEAAKYFMSYEIQLWNLYGQDREIDKRDVLAQQAAQEFFMEVEAFAPRDNDVDVTVILNDSSSDEVKRVSTFNALAATMHYMNRKQDVTLKKGKDIEGISMLSIMQESLLAKKSLDKGAKLGSKEAYIREVLAHEEKAIQILQTRYNMFPMVFVDATKKITDKSFVGRIFMAMTAWELDLDQYNLKQLEYYQTEVLQHGLDARDFLTKIGVQPLMQSKVRYVLNNMHIKVSGKKSPQIVAVQMKIIETLKNLHPAIKIVDNKETAKK